mmetsp:Transcript_19785/g.35182  ORF Transcript_19785/g.35182 Transcript_19785/m.35182 type:complete len:273 (-) Transcript_19785:33-851(-)
MHKIRTQIRTRSSTLEDHKVMDMGHRAMATARSQAMVTAHQAVATAMALLAVATAHRAMAMAHQALRQAMVMGLVPITVQEDLATSMDQDLHRAQVTTRAGLVVSLGLVVGAIHLPATAADAGAQAQEATEEGATRVAVEEEARVATRLRLQRMLRIPLQIKAGMCHHHLLILAKLVAPGGHPVVEEEEVESLLHQLMAAPAMAAMVVVEVMVHQAPRPRTSLQRRTQVVATDEQRMLEHFPCFTRDVSSCARATVAPQVRRPCPVGRMRMA